MSQVEIQYDEFLSLLNKEIPKTDVNLLVKIMYLERKLPDVAPRVELHIEYKSNVDTIKKQEKIRAKYGFPIQPSLHGLTAIGQMNISIVEDISRDEEIKHISGNATPASY